MRTKATNGHSVTNGRVKYTRHAGDIVKITRNMTRKSSYDQGKVQAHAVSETFFKLARRIIS